MKFCSSYGIYMVFLKNYSVYIAIILSSSKRIKKMYFT